MEMLNKFNSCFPDSKYREISPYYSGDDHAKYQNSKSPINTKILSLKIMVIIHKMLNY